MFSTWQCFHLFHYFLFLVKFILGDGPWGSVKRIFRLWFCEDCANNEGNRRVDGHPWEGKGEKAIVIRIGEQRDNIHPREREEEEGISNLVLNFAWPASIYFSPFCSFPLPFYHVKQTRAVFSSQQTIVLILSLRLFIFLKSVLYLEVELMLLAFPIFFLFLFFGHLFPTNSYSHKRMFFLRIGSQTQFVASQVQKGWAKRWKRPWNGPNNGGIDEQIRLISDHRSMGIRSIALLGLKAIHGQGPSGPTLNDPKCPEGQGKRARAHGPVGCGETEQTDQDRRPHLDFAQGRLPRRLWVQLPGDRDQGSGIPGPSYRIPHPLTVQEDLWKSVPGQVFGVNCN